MSRIEKLKIKLLSEPNHFTIREMESLLTALGFEKSEKGRTSGSRVRFYKEGVAHINLHIPHPGNEMQEYAIKDVIAKLKEVGLI